MMTIDKNLVEKAMKESGFTPQLVDAVTHKGFYDDIMSQEDPDSKDVYVLYGILNISGKQNKQAVFGGTFSIFSGDTIFAAGRPRE